MSEDFVYVRIDVKKYSLRNGSDDVLFDTWCPRPERRPVFF